MWSTLAVREASGDGPTHNNNSLDASGGSNEFRIADFELRIEFFISEVSIDEWNESQG